MYAEEKTQLARGFFFKYIVSCQQVKAILIRIFEHNVYL